MIRGIYGPDGIYVRLVARAFEIWKREQKRWKRRLYQPTGALWMFSVEDHYARQSMPLLREEGLRVTELNLEHARKRFPQIDFDGVRTIFYEEDAGYLRARRCCEAVWLDFVKNGGDYRQLEVRPARMDKSRLEGVQLSDGTRLEADLYLFAAGPWLGRLFPRLLKDRIHPTRQEVFYFGTPAADLRYSESNLPVWVDFGKSIFYGIPGSDRRGFKIADDTRGEAFDPTHGERVPTTSAIQESRRYLARRFPGLSGAPLLEARVCQYENSPDGHLIFDRHPRAANLWLLGGGSGHGFKLGPALGEYVAERLLGRSEIDPFFSLSRFKDVGGSSTQMQG